MFIAYTDLCEHTYTDMRTRTWTVMDGVAVWLTCSYYSTTTQTILLLQLFVPQKSELFDWEWRSAVCYTRESVWENATRHNTSRKRPADWPPAACVWETHTPNGDKIAFIGRQKVNVLDSATSRSVCRWTIFVVVVTTLHSLHHVTTSLTVSSEGQNEYREEGRVKSILFLSHTSDTCQDSQYVKQGVLVRQRGDNLRGGENLWGLLIGSGATNFRWWCVHEGEILKKLSFSLARLLASPRLQQP